MPKNQIDRVVIRKMALEGYMDSEIAEQLGCSKTSVFRIRRNELKLKRHEHELLLTQLRKLTFSWDKKNKHWLNARVYFNNFIFKRMGMEPTELVFYKTTFQAPRTLILEFKKLDEIDDMTRIRMFRGRRKTDAEK